MRLTSVSFTKPDDCIDKKLKSICSVDTISIPINLSLYLLKYIYTTSQKIFFLRLKVLFLIKQVNHHNDFINYSKIHTNLNYINNKPTQKHEKILKPLIH